MHVIWSRINGMPGKIKHLIIGTVFLPSIIFVTSLSYLGIARLLVLMSRLYLYYRLAYSHLPDLPRT
jgi:hypothetical protein